MHLLRTEMRSLDETAEAVDLDHTCAHAPRHVVGGRFVGDVVDDDVEAVTREGARDRGADSAARAGHQRGASSGRHGSVPASGPR